MFPSDNIQCAAACVLREFDDWLHQFAEVTSRARSRFESHDWAEGRRDAAERLTLYDVGLTRAAEEIQVMPGGVERAHEIWPALKQAFTGLALLWPLTRQQKEYDSEILHAVFFRNKAAYLVGRILVGAAIVPLVIPLYHGSHGICADAVLLTTADVHNVFGFAYSSFQVATSSPQDVVHFLRSIMPHKPVSEIYNSIGFERHGKTVFYRDLHRFVHLSKERYLVASAAASSETSFPTTAASAFFEVNSRRKGPVHHPLRDYQTHAVPRSVRNAVTLRRSNGGIRNSSARHSNPERAGAFPRP